MSKGVVLGGYQISNALIAALLVASTTGAGVATDSFSGVTEDFDNPLSGPSDNVTQNNQTDESTDSSDSDSDSSDNQDSSDDGSDSSDSDSDSSDSSGSDTDSSDGSDRDSSDSSEDDGGFLDDVLGGDEEQDSENQTDEQDNQNQDETQDNETEDTDSSDNTTDSSVELPYIYQPDPAGTGPGQKIYDTMSVPVEIELIGENANYEVKIDGETYFEGSLEGEETINTTVDMSNTGKHELEVDLTSSGEVLESVTRTFNISETTEDSTEFEWLGTVTANTDVGLRLWGDGEKLSGETVSVDGEEIGQTNQDGEITVSIPYQDNLTLSTSYSGIQDKTYEIQGEAQEPQIVLNDPFDTESFNTQTGTNRDVTFEADVEITEDSGTASLMIDGSEAYTQDLSSGTNSISATQALSGGTHNWQVEVDTPEYNVSSSSRSLTVNEEEVPNGLSLQNNATAGEYNYVRLYDSGDPVEGTQITVNSDSIGTTDSNGEVGFEVPNAQEITVEASGYDSITQSVEGYTEEIDMSFSFSNTVYQGRSNTLTVTDQGSGDALSDATVYVNGVEQEGQTDSSGQITFTVPEENSVTVKAVKDNSDDNQSFTAEVPPIDITWFGPEDGASINDYEAEFDFSLDLQESATATLDVEGQQQLQQDLSSGSHSITEQVKFENSGTRDYTLTVDSSSETRTETGSFTTEQDMPPIDITIDSPTDGETIDDYKTTIGYGFDSPEDFNYTVSIDGREVESMELLESQGGSVSTVANCLEAGQHTLEVSAVGSSSDRTSEKSLQFETSIARPVADFVVTVPQEGEVFNDDISPEYTVVACQPADFTSSITDQGSTVESIQSVSLERYEKIISPVPSISLESGSYNISLSAEHEETKEKKVYFEVN